VTTGGIFVILVILLFLRNLRGGIIMAITIPTSMIVTFLFMYIKGYTINMISLTSLSIAIGMVVDNGIVVLENIFQHLERGARPREAALEGAAEVSGAIMASTLTTVVIFFPVVFLGGIVGVLFSQLAFMITIALLSSLVVAMALVPTLASLMLTQIKPRGVLGWLYEKSELGFKALESGYRFLLGVAIHNKLLTFTLIVAVTLSSVLLVPYVGTEFMPQNDNGFLQASIELPPGTKKEVTAKYARELSARLYKAIPEIQAMLTSWGKSSDSAIGASFGGQQQGDNYATVFMSLVSKRKRARSNKEVSESLQHLTTIFPGALVKISAEDQMQSMIFGGGKPITVEIYGENEYVASTLATTIEQKLKKIPGTIEVEISRRDGVPEMAVMVDREKAAMMGVNMYTVGNTVRTAFNGITVSKFREAGKEHDIYLRLRAKDRSSLKKLMYLKIPTVAGGYVDLGNIATLEQSQGPVAIERKNQQRIVKVSAGIMGRDLGSVSKDVETMLKTVKTPEGFSIQLAGAREEQNESFSLLMLAMGLGALLVYFVMAAQFESLRDPFIILFTIPFAMMGALWSFVISGQTLSMLSFVGLIMLVGIVVNNGIVLVDYINILRARGMGVIEAVMQGGTSRLRPVLMTTITTIIGMIPLSQSTGEGSEMWVAMATVVIGGLIVSTFITLFFVPIMYTFFELGHQRRIDRKLARRKKQHLTELELAKEQNA
ncbi:efflux RND transporter permease subunit, partial [Myxococcota bacterium]|nr:efflux RND transporter permease subunit [Myxococcota bacterium]MBU1536644.1 efflux RND transporter permease subunit [Myxococcota bacterium]